jgi:hypothetical protein
MIQIRNPLKLIKIGLPLLVLIAFTGCYGYVDGGGYGGTVVVPGPTVAVYGGGYYGGGVYEHGGDVHGYSHRGYDSRAVAHPAGGVHNEKR